jgi:hypothetical protein
MICFLQLRVKAVAHLRPIKPHAPRLPDPQSDAEHKDAPRLTPYPRAPPKDIKPSFPLLF